MAEQEQEQTVNPDETIPQAPAPEGSDGEAPEGELTSEQALLVRLEDPTDVSPLDPVRDMEQVVHVTDQREDIGNAASNLDSIRNAPLAAAGQSRHPARENAK